MSLFKKKKRGSGDATPDWIQQLEIFANEVGDSKYIAEQIITACLQSREDIAEQTWGHIDANQKDGVFWYMVGMALAMMEYNAFLTDVIEGNINEDDG